MTWTITYQPAGGTQFTLEAQYASGSTALRLRGSVDTADEASLAAFKAAARAAMESEQLSAATFQQMADELNSVDEPPSKRVAKTKGR